MRLLFLIALMLAPPAIAEPIAMSIAFSEGRYDEAAEMGEAHASADGYAFAARAHLAEAMSTQETNPQPDLLSTAERFARHALEIDPNHSEGRLQLAIALSLKARAMSAGTAMRSGYGQTARDLAQSVLRDDPANFYAHGFLSVWHIEVVRRGGRFGASMMGASLNKAREHYTQARAIRDSDAATHWQYARALASLNPRAHRSVILAALDRALKAPAQSELETLMQARAKKLLTCLTEQSDCKPKALARALL
ncbi:MAG: hypothetical protein AAGJ84_10635 [Pseudomonadota bacterium]